jgi:succinate dehydrogenase / fumarate reductase iron-sulfur subunit
MTTAVFKIWRGDVKGGGFVDYATEISEGMVVLDAVHHIQATRANDLACRWNCKAGKCGSCSAEINGMPKLMCMTRLDQLPLDQPVTIEPMRAFPRIRDLTTDVSWNYRVKKKIKEFRLRRRAGNASARYRGQSCGTEAGRRHWVLQHHQVLHQGLSREHQDH